MTHPHLHALFEAHHEFRMRTAPEYATYEGDHRFDDQASDFSHAAEEQNHQAHLDFRHRLHAIPRAELSTDDQLNYDLFEALLQEHIDEHAFANHLMPLNQMFGFQLFLPRLIDIQPLTTAEQYPAYFARLKAFPQQVADVIENMRLGITRKLVSPRFAVELSLAQMQRLLEPAPEKSVFCLPLINNRSLSDADRSRLGDELTGLVRDVITPAYEQLHDFARDEYLPHCRTSDGLWDLPDGAAFYRHLISKYTVPNLDADTIHELGLQEVHRLHKAKETLKDELGFEGSVMEFNHYLRTGPEFYFDSREAMLEAFDETMAEAYRRIPPLFHHLPKAECELKEVEAYKAESSPQAYYMPAPENGSRPGYYYINTYDLPSRPRHALTALTLHEAVPGHHLQISLAQELQHLPYFRRRLHVTAYIEGWGLYAEHLGYEMNMYEDRYQHYGALGFEIWRACRLVVDTGLHAKGWTRQQGVDFMKQHVANTELDIRNEVDRYVVFPGQALSYKIGELKIKELRARAEAHLGERFDIRDFHDVVLRNGALPLATLEAQVDAWLASA